MCQMTRKARIDAWLADSAGGYTQEELQASFRLVQNADHWKNPIEAVIDRDQMDVVGKAVAWFTGTAASFEETDDPNRVLVTAAGYFCGPCN